MRKPILWFVLLIGCYSLNLRAQKPVSFFEEHIDFALESEYFSINGIYSFCNTSGTEINQTIIFPFADKTTTIDSIRIVNLNSGKTIKFQRLESSVLFNFTLSPKDTVDVNIFYRQKISVVNKYIITSTQTWGKPLEKAVYTLTTEKTLKIKSFSYPPDSVEAIKDKRIYFWEKQQFMPTSDFEITIDK